MNASLKRLAGVLCGIIATEVKFSCLIICPVLHPENTSVLIQNTTDGSLSFETMGHNCCVLLIKINMLNKEILLQKGKNV